MDAAVQGRGRRLACLPPGSGDPWSRAVTANFYTWLHGRRFCLKLLTFRGINAYSYTSVVIICTFAVSNSRERARDKMSLLYFFLQTLQRNQRPSFNLISYYIYRFSGHIVEHKKNIFFDVRLTVHRNSVWIRKTN